MTSLVTIICKLLVFVSLVVYCIMIRAVRHNFDTIFHHLSESEA